MGKRIISQARGHGGPRYRVRRAGFKYRINYASPDLAGAGEVLKIINSPCHSAPIAKIKIEKEIFFIPASQGLYEGQKIEICKERIERGDIIELKKIPIGARVFNIENRPGDGGKMVRSGGGFAIVLKKDSEGVTLEMSNKKEVKVNEDCRATVGTIAGQGRIIKPIVKAGKKHMMMKAIGKPWHRTSAVKMNAVDHPFGGGRGKRIKSKIAKRNAPPGRRVGHLRPRRTGHIR